MRIYQWRQRRKWSLRKMASEVSAITGERVSASTVLRWETGRSEPTLRSALAIQKVCGDDVPLSSLLVRR